MTQSVRAQILERRTYLRPLDANGTVFETREQAWRRVINHQQWLWERSLGEDLNQGQLGELEELYDLFMEGKATVSGRTRWLGGTDVSKKRESSQFNCSFMTIQTVNDVVDMLWLLLQGCGVGFRANVGVLNGFANRIDDVEIIRSKKVTVFDLNGNAINDPSLKGFPDSVETFDRATGIWRIRLGDSAEAWAKFFGKLLAFKGHAKKLIIDFSEIRPAGQRLAGYGWISSGDEQIAIAVDSIIGIMNNSAGKLLTAIDILDIGNMLGTILSSRRSAEICLYPFGGPEWEEFATAKMGHLEHTAEVPLHVYTGKSLDEDIVDTLPAGTRFYDYGGEHGEWYKIDEKPDKYINRATITEALKHRSMSNNSILFEKKPTRRELTKVFKMIEAAGGSEPGFINAVEATRRAPYFKGVNPCAEILLGDKSFCNLVETVLSRFNGDEIGLHRAHKIIARANYRQTCVDLDDGILQRTWHELNEFLHLCGVGVTGVVGWEHNLDGEHWEDLRDVAHEGVHGMADELGTPRAQLVTTIKPSGTQSKVAGRMGDEIGEGIHKPLGRYIFNTVKFGAADPLVPALAEAGYDVRIDSSDKSARLVKFPVEFSNIDFDDAEMVIDGEKVTVPVNLETAVSQLDRYKIVQDHYVDHNCSITISYDLDEVPDIINWLMDNWDSYVGVSFLYRTDPTKTAADLGYAYLPQAVVDKATYEAYVSTLRLVNLDGTDTEDMIQGEECVTGACPIR